MDDHYASLTAAALAFVGSHFAFSHPFRAPLVARLGEKGFMGLYSLIALASFGWMVLAFRAVPMVGTGLWDGTGDFAWGLASAVMLLASVLLVGSFQGNPAMPDPRAKENARRTPRGVFAVTRHPMMWSFALWSLAHVIVSPTTRVLILAGAMAFLALVGAVLQDNKKIVTLGESWQIWERRTSYWPRLQALPAAGPTAWLGGTALWLAATWAHGWAIGMPAGLWRWL